MKKKSAEKFYEMIKKFIEEEKVEYGEVMAMLSIYFLSVMEKNKFTQKQADNILDCMKDNFNEDN